MKNQHLLYSDPLYIIERLKEIDPNYFVVYNFDKSVYEVHNKGQSGSTYALTLPYNCLDERAIDLVRFSRRERSEEIIKQIDNQNEQLKKQMVKRAIEQIREVTE